MTFFVPRLRDNYDRPRTLFSPSRKILKNCRAKNDILETANYRLRGRSRENLRGAICEDTGSYLSTVLLGRRWRGRCNWSGGG
jgi:hypothetical protein